MIALMSLGMIAYAFFMMNEKQMIIKQEIDRTRMLKIKANEGRKGGNVLLERKREDLTSGRTLF